MLTMRYQVHWWLGRIWYDRILTPRAIDTTKWKHPNISNANPRPLGSMPQKGIVSYTMSINRQNPLAGTLNAAIFNTFRRTRHQILYWAVPMLIAYETFNWAQER